MERMAFTQIETGEIIIDDNAQNPVPLIWSSNKNLKMFDDKELECCCHGFPSKVACWIYQICQQN